MDVADEMRLVLVAVGEADPVELTDVSGGVVDSEITVVEPAVATEEKLMLLAFNEIVRDVVSVTCVNPPPTVKSAVAVINCTMT